MLIFIGQRKVEENRKGKRNQSQTSTQSTAVSESSPEAPQEELQQEPQQNNPTNLLDNAAAIVDTLATDEKKESEEKK